MTPPWNLDTSQTLQREWCRGMKQREDKVKCQSGIKMRCCEIIVCPHSEKGERRQPRKRIKNYQPAFEQREREHPKIHNEQVAEQKRRPLRDRFKREQIERRAHRHRSKPDPAGEKFRARFSRTL